MKKWIISFCLLWLVGMAGPASAQSGEVNNGYWLNGGQIMHLRDGALVPLTEQAVLPNGLTLLPNGDLVTRDGVRRNLQSGQAIDASGRILYPQTQRNGSVVLVPRSAYVVERDPGLVRPRRAARPSGPVPGFSRQGDSEPGKNRQAGPSLGRGPGSFRQVGPSPGRGRGSFRPAGPAPGRGPGSFRGRIR
jgi:hypothetical protein